VKRFFQVVFSRDLPLDQVVVIGDTAVYKGIIRGGANDAHKGKRFIVTEFSDPRNNIAILVIASTAETLVCEATTQVNERVGHCPIFDDVVFRWAFFALAVSILIYVYRADIIAWLPEMGP
jgi:hypothetical protein